MSNNNNNNNNNSQALVLVEAYPHMVVTRSGQREPIDFKRITERVSALSEGLRVDAFEVMRAVASDIRDGTPTSEIDGMTARAAVQLNTRHPDYIKLAGRILVANMQKSAAPSFSEFIARNADRLRPDFVAFVAETAEALNGFVCNELNLRFDYRAALRWQNQYLLTRGNVVVGDQPQYCYLRVSVSLWFSDPALTSVQQRLAGIESTYRLLAEGYTPTRRRRSRTPAAERPAELLLPAADEGRLPGRHLPDPWQGGARAQVGRRHRRGGAERAGGRAPDQGHRRRLEQPRDDAQAVGRDGALR